MSSSPERGRSPRRPRPRGRAAGRGSDRAAGARGADRSGGPPRRTRPSGHEAPVARGAPAEREGIRLQKLLAAAGVASRRASERLITSGRVTVDGRIVTTLGTRVDPETARIEVDGRRIAVHPGHEYYALNKPEGYLTTASDREGRPTVLGLVRSRRRLFPVGRLDRDTAGLLILTDDGELAHRLAHPRYRVPRVYLAEVRGPVGRPSCQRLTAGVRLEDGVARAARARVRTHSPRASQIELTMMEGRKREVRRMLEAVGHPVVKLVRIAFGPLRLSGLRSGAVRPLTPEEVGELYRAVGL